MVAFPDGGALAEGECAEGGVGVVGVEVERFGEIVDAVVGDDVVAVGGIIPLIAGVVDSAGSGIDCIKIMVEGFHTKGRSAHDHEASDCDGGN